MPVEQVEFVAEHKSARRRYQRPGPGNEEVTSMHAQRTDAARLPLYSRGKVVAHALVDPDDFALVVGQRWHLASNGYPSSSLRLPDGRKTVTRLHRVLLGLKHGDRSVEIDHRNTDKLDNRRSNLRPLTHAENMANRGGPTSRNKSGYRGVFYDKARDKWVANAKYGELHYRERFATAEAAAAAVAVWRHEHMPASEMDRTPPPPAPPKPPREPRPWPERCGRGHDLTDPANVYIQKKNGRPRCHTCQLAGQRARYHRRRAGSHA